MPPRYRRADPQRAGREERRGPERGEPASTPRRRAGTRLSAVSCERKRRMRPSGLFGSCTAAKGVLAGHLPGDRQGLGDREMLGVGATRSHPRSRAPNGRLPARPPPEGLDRSPRAARGSGLSTAVRCDSMLGGIEIVVSSPRFSGSLDLSRGTGRDAVSAAPRSLTRGDPLREERLLTVRRGSAGVGVVGEIAPSSRRIHVPPHANGRTLLPRAADARSPSDRGS